MKTDDVWLLLKERALESTAEGVVIADCTRPEMPIIYVNPAFTAITGYSADEVLERNCRFLQGPDSDPATKEQLRNAIMQRLPCAVEILNYRKDGTPFWNRLSITPVQDDAGHTTHLIGIQSDITRRRNMEDSLRAANEQMNRDLQAAAALQKTQLPQILPRFSGFQFAWRFRPCQELAGDALNIFQIDQDHISVYVLDVSGHGVRAALQSFSLSQNLRAQAGLDLHSPEQILNQLNLKYPMDMQTGTFFTILYGVLNVKTSTFTFASAGHPGPILIRQGQTPRMLDNSSYPIGINPTPDYQSQAIELQKSDKLLLYTDGVVEALSSRDIPYGQERFIRAIERNRAKPVGDLLDCVIKSLDSWACHVTLRDDLSLVGIHCQ